MSLSNRRRLVGTLLVTIALLTAVGLGVGLGLALSKTDNMSQSLRFSRLHQSLPTEIVDRNGRLIDEIIGVSDHPTISLNKIPKYVIYALLTREDQNFFHEGAFSLRGTFRAAWNIVTNNYFSGGSTITQQLAGMLYTNRTKKTIWRKLKELWYAFQIERRFTKDQILQMYLNAVYFGQNKYGIESASEYYFGRPASDLTLAQAAILVIQLADPARYYWLDHPNRARVVQHVVLEEMVQKGYVTQDQVDQSFTDFWDSYPYTRPASVAYGYGDNSKAPYFTDYVQRQLEKDLYGKLDYLRDGLVIHTTLDLDDQEIAARYMREAIKKYNAIYQKNLQRTFATVAPHYIPVVHLLSLAFNLTSVDRVDEARRERDALHYYLHEVNPALDILSSTFGLEPVQIATDRAHFVRLNNAEKTTVEGALITLANHTGGIRAMVGGYDYNSSPFNRAVDARLTEGSSIKPLYYSAAISSGKFTEATELYDGPVVFFNPDGTAYRPRDFLGQWQGHVSLRWALEDSINVPSLEVLQGVGFHTAIDRISRMLGMWKYRNDPSIFPHVYPLGLGVVPLAPINLARAYAVFANQGREVIPEAIKWVQDRRTGKIILEPEKQNFERLRIAGAKAQIMTPQVAYIMINLLEGVVTSGDLWQTAFDIHGWDGMPMAGKTGTTQNWEDAWTTGFSPYYTTSVWFGFDKHGSSLGLGLTGALAAGPVWAKVMKAIDAGKPRIPFPKPASGLVTVRVDADSGLLPSPETKRTKDVLFVAGTQPQRFDTQSEFQQQRNAEIIQKLQNSAAIEGVSPISQLPALGGGGSLGSLGGGSLGGDQSLGSLGGGGSLGDSPKAAGASSRTRSGSAAQGSGGSSSGNGTSGNGGTSAAGINPLLN